MPRCTLIKSCNFKYCIDNNKCLEVTLDKQFPDRAYYASGGIKVGQRKVQETDHPKYADNKVYYYGSGSYITCHYCGSLISRQEITKDHVIPKSKGGLNRSKNKVPACKPCNSEKSSMDYFDYIRFRIINNKTVGKEAMNNYNKQLIHEQNSNR